MGAPVAVVALGVLLCICIIFALILTAFFALLSFIRKRVPCRVNCWFCSSNSWIHYRLRNSWTCKKCEQYNGFLPDGSYNVVLDTRTTNNINYNKNVKRASTAANGLCRKCNTNQQLKIRQLSGFVPMNEKNFDTEVESFRKHLEKVYSLCSICKKYVKQKLSSEKGLLLGTKLLDTRIKNDTEKKISMKDFFINLTKNVLKKLTILFIIFALYNLCTHLELFLSKKIVSVTKRYFKDVSSDVKNASLPYFESAMDVIFQYSENYNITPLLSKQYSSLVTTVDSCSEHSTIAELKNLIKILDNFDFNFVDIVTCIGFILQTSVHLFELNLNVKNFFRDFVWGIAFYVSRTGIDYFHILQVPLGVFLYIFSDSNESKKAKTQKNNKNKLKNLSASKLSDISSEDDIFSDNSDSDSSDSEFSISKSTYLDRNSFKKSPKSVNSFEFRKSPFYSTSTQYKYPLNLSSKHFSNFSQINKNDSELDKSISSLSIGKSNKSCKTDPFVTRQYNCTSPGIFMPYPQFSKPIISPSRLVHGTQQSWVAGGYWGADNSFSNIHETGSSSSQSSGFESLTSSMYRRNVNSFPPSRDESVSSECDRRIEDFPSGNSFNVSSLRNFMPHKSPVFPNMNGNESVFIPSVPFDSSYNMMNGSAFARPNPDKSFVPLRGPFSDSTHAFSS